MIIHHMSDGTIRKSVDGVRIPTKFNKVYELAYKNSLKEKNKNGNCDTSRNLDKK